MRVDILQGDALTVLKTLEPESIHCCVTSPPYYGLRDYGADGQIGLESTPDEYVGKLIEVFREVRRVLHDDGTLWLNLGDSYSGGGRGGVGGTVLDPFGGSGTTGQVAASLGRNVVRIELNPAYIPLIKERMSCK